MFQRSPEYPWPLNWGLVNTQDQTNAPRRVIGEGAKFIYKTGINPGHHESAVHGIDDPEGQRKRDWRIKIYEIIGYQIIATWQERLLITDVQITHAYQELKHCVVIWISLKVEESLHTANSIEPERSRLAFITGSNCGTHIMLKRDAIKGPCKVWT